jgi:RNA polymerase sigma factor (sigma-70 family)
MKMDDARRIYAFAYGKTNDAREAEDLSQEILLALLSSGIGAAENRTAYLYGVCRHVWARYLARNKPHWEATRYESALDFLSDGKDVSEKIEKNAEYERLRREIARLGKTRREALVMRYFEGKSDAEIAKALCISPATVRWHLHKARDDLKGRLQMETRNGMRAPIRMEIGHSGNAVDPTLCGLKDDLLTQNIAWACYGPPKRAEEVARELDVPAVYVENKLDTLAGMEYVKKAGDRYQTRFFIHTPEYILARARFNYVNSGPFADTFFDATRELLPEVRKVGFIGSDLPDEELIWHVLPEFIMRAYHKINDRYHDELHLHHAKPMRPDGTRHWVWARLEPLPRTGDAEFDEYLLNGSVFNIKSNEIEGAESMQYDFQPLNAHRTFGASGTLAVRRAADIMRGKIPDEKDREAIATLARDGYVIDTKLKIPYMTKTERRTYNETLDSAIPRLDMDAILAPFIGYAREMDKLIPSFLDSNERAHRLTSYDAFGTPVYLLVKAGKLALPEPNIARRLSTVVWENNEINLQ